MQDHAHTQQDEGMQARLPAHLHRLARSMAVQYVDGALSSNEALRTLDRATRHPLNGDCFEAGRTEFERTVERLLHG